MAKTIGIGIIGMGWMGTVHSRSYHQVRVRFPGCEGTARLVICADDVEARALEAKRVLGFERSTTDWRAVIADPDVDVVNIAAPNSQHLEMVRAAAAAGKHIFCEKPVGRGPEETTKIERLAREAGVLSWVGFNYRWAPLVQYAKQLIADGKLGTITHYRGRFFAGYASNPEGVLSWRFKHDEAGSGALGDLMSHVTDMAHLMAGPIKRVIGNRATFIPERPTPVPGVGTHFSVGGGPKAPVTNEDYVGALVHFANGAQGTFEVCRIIQGAKCQMAFEVHGTEGALKWDFERMNELQVYRASDDGSRDGYTTIFSGPTHPGHAHFNPGPAIALGYDDLKVIEAYHFLQSLATGQQGVPGFADVLAVARVLAAMERSWTSERWESVE